ncbi:MAG: hypothetical protein ABJD07_06775 [Gemmatimonadaceae bacterium]
MTLVANGTVLSGAGTFAGEAGPAGTSEVAGTVVGSRVQLDFTLHTTLPSATGTSLVHFLGARVGSTLQGTLQYDASATVPAAALFVRADALATTTGITGTVSRGPITPVCVISVPCDAPFSADFFVRQGNRQVATFHSDAAGRFVVLLPPGSYTIVPAADAPLLDPTRQVRAVEVSGGGHLTLADLDFDTGIR